MENFQRLEQIKNVERAIASDLRLGALLRKEFFTADEAPKPPKVIDQKLIDGYVESFTNLQKNGACNQKTLDAFKAASEFLPRLEQEGLQKVLDRAAKDKDVDTELVVRHIWEILKQAGFTDIQPFTRDGMSGNFIVKNKDEIYISIAFSKVDDKEKGLVKGAGVGVDFKNGYPKKRN